ncbi:MAG: iron ABC transporter substrate-binding protein [Rikenellaceae bacterium]|nr:iron ABC transporter substrate-binding protein [Rikenellaceae bacterium]
MKRLVAYLTIVALALGLWGCPEGQTQITCGEVVYTPHSAAGFEIVATEGASTVLRILTPWPAAKGVFKEVFISREGESAPSGFGGQVVKASPQRVVCLSSSHLAYIDAVGQIDAVVGVSGGTYVSNHHIAEGLAQGSVREIGYDANINYELLAALRPDVVFIYGTTGENGAMSQKLEELRIPYIYISDHTENTPLGKSEWVVAFGEVFDCRQGAEDVFEGIGEKYESLRLSALAASSKPRVMLNSPYKDVWFVPSRESYVVRLIEDAGGEYVCGGAEGDLSRPISGESAYVYLSEADVWLNPNAARTMAALTAENPKFAQTEVVREGRVYNCTARSTASGGSDFWESGALRADVVLADMLAILHPELVAEDYELYYFEQLK